MGDDLRTQAVKTQGLHRAARDPGIDTNPWPLRNDVGRHRACSREEILQRILCAYPEFNGVTSEVDAFLFKRHGLATSRTDHLLHNVDAANRLRHRMLDLDAGVHLDEIETSTRVDEILNGACTVVSNCLCDIQRRKVQALANMVVQIWCRRFLDQFLTTPLDAALPVAQVYYPPMLVRNYLNLNVPNLFAKKSLDVYLVASEGTVCLTPNFLKCGDKFLLVVGDSDSASATTQYSF
ncbi:hypothetical protein EMIT0158MI4_110064 [Burkholderia ambifaria]